MSKIKVNSIEAATGSTITIPSGQTLDISSTTLTLPSTIVTTTGTQTLTNKTIGVSQLTGTLPVANGGTGLTSLGSASQVLRVNSGATALEFGTVASGIVQVKSTILTSVVSFGSSSGMVTGLQCSITPTSASNKILVFLQCVVGNSGTTTSSMAIRREAGATATTSGTRVGGGTASSNRPSSVAWSGTPYQDWNGTNIGFHFLDNPATTSQITYGAEITGHDNSGLYIGRTNRDSDDVNHGRYSSNLTLMEISSGVL